MGVVAALASRICQGTRDEMGWCCSNEAGLAHARSSGSCPVTNPVHALAGGLRGSFEAPSSVYLHSLIWSC